MGFVTYNLHSVTVASAARAGVHVQGLGQQQQWHVISIVGSSQPASKKKGSNIATQIACSA